MKCLYIFISGLVIATFDFFKKKKKNRKIKDFFHLFDTFWLHPELYKNIRKILYNK